jgi:hypothetical protein
MAGRDDRLPEQAAGLVEARVDVIAAEGVAASSEEEVDLHREPQGGRSSRQGVSAS